MALVSMRKSGTVLGGAALLVAAFAAGWLARGVREPAPPPMREIREAGLAPGRWINPLLECEEAEAVLRRPALRPFKHRLQTLVDVRRTTGDIEFGSVYFRELNDGSWVGVNEQVGYIPASLLKLPVLISALKRAERDPAFLGRRVRFPGGRDLNAVMHFRPPEALASGASYTVEELCTRSVRYSDNNATGLLSELIPAPEQERTLRGLGVLPEMLEARGKLNVKTVSAFFRVLYNASWLDRERSELALEMLSRSSFREGIVAGVPADVRVSSKYGEAALQLRSYQLHEFAIVYHERRPYLLGVMSQGSDLAAMTRFIRDVSRAVYDEVDR